MIRPMGTLTPTRIKQFKRIIATAKAAGSPHDQVEFLLNRASYVPYPWQWQFHAAARAADNPGGPTDIGLGGARGPGKSHAILSQVALDDCQRVAGLKVLFLRQTGVSAAESFDDLTHKTVRGRTEYRKTKNSLRFPNGSRVILGGFKDESDIDKYIGIEYDVIVVEELTQLTKEKYNKLKGSLRTSKPNWRPRIYSSFNPGGIGHAWVREMFVLPYRAHPNEISYDYIEPSTGRAIRVSFIPSTYRENPALNPEYITYLESIGGDLGKAWREGEWDLFAGQYFSEWRYDKHVCAPFAIPLTWKKFRSIDPSGREGITSCHWYALDQDGRVWVYREYYYGPNVINPKTNSPYGIGRDYDEHARAIRKLSESDDGVEEEYLYTVIDTAAFAKAGFSETAAEIYERHGVVGLIPSAKERVVGWNAVHTYLRYDVSTRPILQVFDTCANLIRTLPALQHDERHPEDVDSRGEDHAGDELRYFLRTLREQKAPRVMTLAEKRLEEIKADSDDFDYSYFRG